MQLAWKQHFSASHDDISNWVIFCFLSSKTKTHFQTFLKWQNCSSATCCWRLTLASSIWFRRLLRLSTLRQKVIPFTVLLCLIFSLTKTCIFYRVKWGIITCSQKELCLKYKECKITFWGWIDNSEAEKKVTLCNHFFKFYCIVIRAENKNRKTRPQHKLL